MQINLAGLAAVALFAAAVDSRSCHNDLTVHIKNGVVHGVVNHATPRVREFLGIPYGRPPVGDLRFAPPQPALPFEEYSATRLPPSCMQYPVNGPSITNNDVLELNLGGLNGTTGPISEDCLNLSIWSPRGKPAVGLPVIMFFYGGAFATGGTNVPYQLASQWVERTQRHIVVPFNHRGNIFGYPNAAGLPLEEQNVGLLDQRLAIEWVRDNIAAFGGDPKRIGLWGESSGGVAIAYYSYSFRKDPIANSLIMNSGNEFIDVLTRDPTHANFTYVASQLGCENLSPKEELACMRKVDAFKMTDFMQAYFEAGRTPILTFSPIIDNRTVFENYTALAQAGQVAKLPALIGNNAQDGVSFVPYDPNGVDADLANLMTMTFFFCPTYQSAWTRIAASTGPVYRYLYGGNFTNISPKGWMGAWHGSELPLIFGTHPLYRGNSTDLEYDTSYAMQDAWLEFVATAGKEMSIKNWNVWDKVDGGQVVEFGNSVPARLIDSKNMEQSCGM